MVDFTEQEKASILSQLSHGLGLCVVKTLDDQAARITELESKVEAAGLFLCEELKLRKEAEKQRDDAVLLAMGRASAETYYAEVQARKAAEARIEQLETDLRETRAAYKAEYKVELEALRERVTKAIDILSNQGTGTWYAVPALEALRG